MTSTPNRRHQVLWFGAAMAVSVPGLVLRLSGAEPEPWIGALVFGVAVIGAAFVLSWSAEAAQVDIGAGLALALIALIAVLPEYAVDFVFTWKAGTDTERFAPLALANMTGGNQLLIGVGWPLVTLLAASRLRRRSRDEPGQPAPGRPVAVRLERVHSIEIAFLTLACLYGLSLPLRSSLTLFDAAVLVAIYAGYLVRIARMPGEEPDLVGPAELLGAMPPQRRRLAVGGLLLWAAGMVLACAEPFAESLVATGEHFGVSTFVLVKWVAPIASEAPELLVAGLFAWRLHASTGLGALVSSKVNQWTLLVGTLPIVFAISSSSWHGLPLDAEQQAELLVTAAQSVLAVAVLANLSINEREAWVLLGLFGAQFGAEALIPVQHRVEGRVVIGVLYLALAAVVLVQHWRAMRTTMADGLFTPPGELSAPIGTGAPSSATQR